MKTYLPFIATVIFSLSQPQLYGMGNEPFFESFFSEENNSTCTPGLIDSTDLYATSINTTSDTIGSTSSSTSGASDSVSDFGAQGNVLLEQAFDSFDFYATEGKETQNNVPSVATELEKQNINVLLSDFLNNEQNSTTNTVPQQILKNIPELQKKRSRKDDEKSFENQKNEQNSTTNIVPAQKTIASMKKRLREDEKKSLKNQSEQKKTCFNKNGATSSRSRSAKIKDTIMDFPIGEWTQNDWSRLAPESKQRVIATLLKQAGTSTVALTEIQEMFEKFIAKAASLLYWLFDPIIKNQTSPMLQIVTNSNVKQSLVHFKFIMNRVNKKIYDSQDRQGATQRIHYNLLADKLEKCISKNTNPECLSLITKSIDVIRNALSGEREIEDIFNELNMQLGLQGTQSQQANLLNISLLPQNQKVAIPQVPNVIQPQNTIMTIAKNTENNSSLVVKTQAPQKAVYTNFRFVNGKMVEEKAEDFPISHWDQSNWSRISTLKLRQKVIVALFKKAGNSVEQLAEVKKVIEQNLKSASILLGWFFTEKENPPSPLIRLSNQDNQYSLTHLVSIFNIFNVNIYKKKGSNGATGKANYKKFFNGLKKCTSNNINPECSNLIKKVMQVRDGAPRLHSTLFIFEELKKLLNPQNQQSNILPTQVALNKIAQK